MKLPWFGRRNTEAKADNFTPVDIIHRGPLRTGYPYARDISQGLGSNVIMSPMNWVMRNFTEAEPRAQSLNGGVWKFLPDHDLSLLLENPNPFYDGDTMWKATVLSHWLDGNSYWWKVRNRFGDVIQLWYLPHFLVEPKWPRDGSTFISHYEYRVRGAGHPQIIPVRDIVHFRFGLDPENPRLGLSTLKPLLREVFTDEEASNFSASILRNMGVPGVIISPKSEKALPSPAEAEKLKEYIRTNFTGDKRGESFAFGVPTEIAQFGFDPSKLLLTELRDITEERVCAAIGIPSAVVGFGSGLQSTKVGATMRELRQLAWNACITPQQKSIAKQLTKQLMPDFVSQLRRYRIRFDMSDVAAFQEELTARAERAATLVQAGILRVDRAQEMLGLEVDPSRQIYLQAGMGTAPAKPPADDGDDDDGVPPAIAARMNGNGRNSHDEE